MSKDPLIFIFLFCLLLYLLIFSIASVLIAHEYIFHFSCDFLLQINLFDIFHHYVHLYVDRHQEIVTEFNTFSFSATETFQLTSKYLPCKALHNRHLRSICCYMAFNLTTEVIFWILFGCICKACTWSNKLSLKHFSFL